MSHTHVETSSNTCDYLSAKFSLNWIFTAWGTYGHPWGAGQQRTWYAFASNPIIFRVRNSIRSVWGFEYTYRHFLLSLLAYLIYNPFGIKTYILSQLDLTTTERREGLDWNQHISIYILLYPFIPSIYPSKMFEAIAIGALTISATLNCCAGALILSDLF